MKPFKRNRIRKTSIISAAALGVFASEFKALAQSVLFPPPSLSPEESEPASQLANNNAVTPTKSEDAESGSPAPVQHAEKFFQWGPVLLRPHVSYQYLYGTGIQTAPGKPADTVTHTFSPGMLFELGSHWTLDYIPNIRFFSDSRFRNTIDNSVSLNGFTTYDDWTWGLAQAFSQADEPQAETGSQVAVESYSSRLNASYQFATKMSIEADVNANFEFVGKNTAREALSDSRDYSMTDWLNYQWNPKLAFGLGATGGYSDQSGGSKTVDEQVLGRVTWHPGRKLTMAIKGGVEDRQFIASGQGDAVNPIFDASLRYQMFKKTTLTLDATREVDVSLFTGQITEMTQINAGIRQRLLGKLQLSVGGGYLTSKYKGAFTEVTPNRSDEVISITLGLGMAFLKHGSIGTFYQYSHNTSTDTGFTFSSNQAGFTVTWAY